MTGLIDWEPLHTMPILFLRSQYPPLMAREGHLPGFDLIERLSTSSGPKQSSDDNNISERTFSPKRRTSRKMTFYIDGTSSTEMTRETEFRENQLMRNEFDRRVKELRSLWLEGRAGQQG